MDEYLRPAMAYIHGKPTAVQYVMDDFGNAHILTGDVLRQWADRIVDAVVLPKYNYMN